MKTSSKQTAAARSSLARGSAHYAGDKSKPFWHRVNAIKDDADRSALYALGCVLQNIEGYVLRQLDNAEGNKAKWYVGSDGIITLTVPAKEKTP